MKKHCKKIPYASEKEALDSYRAMNMTQDGVTEKTAYICKECKVWHLTSMSKEDSKRLSNKQNPISKSNYGFKRNRAYRKAQSKLNEINALIREQAFKDRLKTKSKILTKLLRLEHIARNDKN